jgi:hypothetical protein
MKGEVWSGQLDYVDTDKGVIDIVIKSGESVNLKISSEILLPFSSSWESLLGEDVRVIVINGEGKRVCWELEEEN